MLAKAALVIGSLFAGGAVALGAFHAHGLRRHLETQTSDAAAVQKRLDNCETAVRYQMYHALALIAVGTLAASRRCLGLTIAAALFFGGTTMFSGGLYSIVFADQVIHWSIVPVGGLLLIVGWLALASAGIGLKECSGEPRT